MRVLYFLCFFVFFNSTTIAQESLGNIVASPNRSSVEVDKVGSSVFYIEKEDIEKSSATTSSGLLQEFGGFTIAPKGNKGTDPGYFNRGLSRKYIKVLVDGMDLSDITSTQEEPTYIDNIMLSNIDNIEILNGSQGTLYGGNAIGGVITINSLLPEKYGLTNSSNVEGGSYSSIKTSNSTKFANKKIELVFNLDAERSGGYNSFIDTGIAPTEKDGYYLYGSNFLSSFKVRNNLEVNLNGRFYKQHNEYDNNFAYPGDNVSYFRDDKLYALLLDLMYNTKGVSHKLSFQPTYTTRISTSGTSYEYDGRKNKLEYIISNNLLGFYNLSGIDFLRKNADMNGTIADKEVYSIFTEFRFEPLNNTNVDASVRREYDSNYDIFDTGRIQVNHKLLRSMIIRGSLGTGYRTPTPYELYSSYGNTNLTPEKSVSFDFGSEINLNKNKSTFYLGIFETKVEDIITYASSKYRQSTANLKTYGLESRFKTRLYDNLTASLNYTKTNGKENDGDSITLVPKDKAIISLNYTPTKKINMNTYYLFQNKAKDTKYNELPTYRTLNLNTSFSYTKKAKAYLKIENLLDRNNIINRGGGTTENLGYRSPGQSIYIGIKFEN